jgi:hypothetical protein
MEVEMKQIDEENEFENLPEDDSENVSVEANNKHEIHQLGGQVNSNQAHLHSDQNNHIPTEKKKRGNFLFRQELHSFTPECNPTFGIIFNSIAILFFLGLGLPTIILAEANKEYEINYSGWYINL